MKCFKRSMLRASSYIASPRGPSSWLPPNPPRVSVLGARSKGSELKALCAVQDATSEEALPLAIGHEIGAVEILETFED